MIRLVRVAGPGRPAHRLKVHVGLLDPTDPTSTRTLCDRPRGRLVEYDVVPEPVTCSACADLLGILATVEVAR